VFSAGIAEFSHLSAFKKEIGVVNDWLFRRQGDKGISMKDEQRRGRFVRIHHNIVLSLEFISLRDEV
jgi:hypothetical protein